MATRWPEMVVKWPFQKVVSFLSKQTLLSSMPFLNNWFVTIKFNGKAKLFLASIFYESIKPIFLPEQLLSNQENERKQTNTYFWLSSICSFFSIFLSTHYSVLLGSYYRYWYLYTYCSDFWLIVRFIFDSTIPTYYLYCSKKSVLYCWFLILSCSSNYMYCYQKQGL